MAGNIKKLEADVVIAGSGPGGCAIAKELSKKEKKVILRAEAIIGLSATALAFSSAWKRDSISRFL